jgi:hypothetical protein
MKLVSKKPREEPPPQYPGGEKSIELQLLASCCPSESSVKLPRAPNPLILQRGNSGDGNVQVTIDQLRAEYSSGEPHTKRNEEV